MQTRTLGRDNEEESKMRSKFTRMAAAIAAATIAIAVLAGCSSNSTEADADTATFTCDQVSEASIKAAEKEAKTAESTLDEAAPFEEKDAKTALATATLKVETLNTRATECVEEAEEAAATKVVQAELAQCRTTAIVTYMTEQGFVDGEYVIGVNNVDTTKAAFTQQGSAGFRGNSSIAKTREEYQKLLKSKEDNDVATVAPQIKKLEAEGFKESVILNADNWELVQSNVESLTLGNTGLNGDSVVSVGTTESAAGDAAWIFVNPDTCVVPRASIDAAGNPIPEETPIQDRPVAAVRPGCHNPTDGLRPKTPYVPPVTPPLDEKKPEESSAWNPANPQNIVRDNGEHTTNWNDGSTDPQGYQPSAADVAAAQEAARKAAEADAARRAAEAEAARKAAEQAGAGTVENSTEDLGESTSPGW